MKLMRLTRWMLLVTLCGLLVASGCDQSGGPSTRPSTPPKTTDTTTPDKPADSTTKPGDTTAKPLTPDTPTTPDKPDTTAKPDAPAGAATITPVEPMARKAVVNGWLNWRGPHQNNTSDETGLPDKVSTDSDGGNLLWSMDMSGRGSPVIAGNRVYSWGYSGEGPDLQEQLSCLDADTGEVIWKHRFNDYISDIIYDRYTIGSPTIDPETGNVFLMTSPGDLMCFTPDGKLVWSISMMEDFGRMTFPNGRTGAPVIEGGLVIVNTISTNWGAQGPPRNRFYAFDKLTGQSVWASAPGVGPPFLKDSSFSTPMFDFDKEGRRVFYVGIGSGALACINARTGEPIWRFQMAVGGVNVSPVVHKSSDGERHVIVCHDTENLDSSKLGRMVAVRADAVGKPDPKWGGAPLLEKSAEVWRNDKVSMFTSSPCLVGDRVYQMVNTGELFCVDANTGKTVWTKKLGPDQIHASPIFADGKLYIPVNNGTFWILKPGDDDAEELSKIQLAGNCLGTPAIWNGKIYVHTTRKLYCFGTKGDNPGAPKAWPMPEPAAQGKAVAMQGVPDEVLLAPGQKQLVKLRAIDDKGTVVGMVTGANWAKFIPPTAKVKAEMDADFDAQGEVVARADSVPSAGAFKATAGDGLSAVIRGRVLTSLPYTEDFESFNIDTPLPSDTSVKFAYPPLAWIGARFKWDVREIEGSKVLTKTLDNLILQRAMTFFGPSSMKNYTLQADVMTDGNRRLRSEVGLINQRYIVVLKGNHRQLEVNSNHERVKVAVPFPVEPKVWYTLKTRVDVNADGSGVVRAKVWERGQPEPEQWTIEVPHQTAHTQGAPGVFGFSPQSRFSVYVDNIKATPNDTGKASE